MKHVLLFLSLAFAVAAGAVFCAPGTPARICAGLLLAAAGGVGMLLLDVCDAAVKKLHKTIDEKNQDLRRKSWDVTAHRNTIASPEGKLERARQEGMLN